MAEESPGKQGSEREMEFKYIFNKDYNPLYINGAYGGLNPQGEIAVNFYCERQPLPNKDTFHVSKSGELLGPILREPSNFENILIRYIQCGVIMNVESARRVRDWLDDHIKKVEQIMGSKKDD